MKGGCPLTMTYYGSRTVVKNYNIMGIAEATWRVRMICVAELGPKGIRVHAISPGPLATRAASGILEFDKLLEKAKTKAPAGGLRDYVGAATAFLAHDAARLITGDTIFITSTADITSSIDESVWFVPKSWPSCPDGFVKHVTLAMLKRCRFQITPAEPNRTG